MLWLRKVIYGGGKIPEIIGDNAGELFMKKIDEQCSYARICLLFSLLQKYHPDSQITKNKEISKLIEDLGEKSKAIKKKLKDIVSSDTEYLIINSRKNRNANNTNL